MRRAIYQKARFLMTALLLSAFLLVSAGSCKKEKKDDTTGLLMLWLLGQNQSSYLVDIPTGVAK